MKYVNLFFMAALSFISMYILMYIMVNEFANVYPNLNQLYMAGLMTMPMILIELFLMRSMYNNKRANCFIGISSLTIFIFLIIFIKRQTGISDREFLKSMIPHHAGALLMCEKASLQNPEIKRFCKNILSTQQSEIDFMKAQLKTLKN